jgi:hypothetical protein
VTGRGGKGRELLRREHVTPIVWLLVEAPAALEGERLEAA